MKGIILAGGSGTRLWPLTQVTSKQLLPVFDKPMIYYPLSTLMLAGIREVLIITTPKDQNAFRDLLGSGAQLGMSISYATQARPEGLAQALIIGENFLAGSSCLLILGDNIFHGVGLGKQIGKELPVGGAHIFTYEVEDPSSYGVLTVDRNDNPISIHEKPLEGVSKLAITGLYFFDHQASQLAKTIKPSARGELEITSLLTLYLTKAQLTVTFLPRGTAWLDTGTHKSIHDASTYVRLIEERTGQKIACLEEIAFRNSWLTDDELIDNLTKIENGSIRDYLRKIITKKDPER